MLEGMRAAESERQPSRLDAGSAKFQQLDLLGILAGAENDAQWQVLFGFPRVLSQPA